MIVCRCSYAKCGGRDIPNQQESTFIQLHLIADFSWSEKNTHKNGDKMFAEPHMRYALAKPENKPVRLSFTKICVYNGNFR